MGGQGLCWCQGLSTLALADPTVALWVSWVWFHGGVVEISFSPLSPGPRERVLKGAHQGEEPPSQGPLVGADGSARNTTQLSQEFPGAWAHRLGPTAWALPTQTLATTILLRMARAAVSLKAGSAGRDPRGGRKLPSPVIQTSKPWNQPWKSGLGNNFSSLCRVGSRGCLVELFLQAGGGGASLSDDPC